MDNVYHAPPIPQAFIWKRAHSLTGFWLVLFLIEHLLTNSQAALWIGDDGNGFVRSANFLKNLPYLQVLEIALLGIPLLIHGIWGLIYIFTARYNSFHTDGSAPGIPQYTRNHAFTWQRITSWILLFGIVAHVIHMRFLEYPSTAGIGNEKSYMVPVNLDRGMYTLAKRLDFEIYTPTEVSKTKEKITTAKTPPIADIPSGDDLQILQQKKQELIWLSQLEKFHLRNDQAIIVAKSFGVAELMMVRDTFKNPIMIILYSGLVLAACFHGFNGLWSFMINMGITLNAHAQRVMQTIAVFLMVIVTFMGLIAIWGTYWINLTR